jgi:TatD DNase family protein
MPGVIDTHAHLDEIEELPEVLTAARSAGITGIIAVGSDGDSNRKVLDIARRYPDFIYPAIGLHPWNIKQNTLEDELAFIREHVNDVVAIGEIGLDYHKRVVALAGKDLQKSVFESLLKIACDSQKVAVIHSRYAWRDAYDLVVKMKIERAVFHWFTGPSSVLREIVGSGYYLSATPAVEYHEEHRRAIRETPLDRLLLETDSPVVYCKGRENEFTSVPGDVLRSLAGVARLRNIHVDAVADKTSANAVRLFGLEGDNFDPKKTNRD